MSTTVARSLAPPLATDSQGNPLHVPEEAVAWRVRRHTGGRPRTVLGPDRRPLQLPLDTSHDDLDDILGPGSYRLEAIDDAGDVLDCVVNAEVGTVGREQGGRDVAPAAAGPPGAMRSSDLRIVMEANVQMARSLADAVRVLSEAQADWTKGLATAKAMPRNAAPRPAVPAPVEAPTPAPAPAASDADSDYEPAWYERLATSIPAEHLPDVISSIGDLVDRFVPSKPKAKREPKVRNASAEDYEDEAPEPPKKEGLAWTPELLAKVEAVKARLTPGEVRLVKSVLANGGPEMRSELARELGPLSVDEAVERVRTMIAGSENKAQKRAAGGER